MAMSSNGIFIYFKKRHIHSWHIRNQSKYFYSRQPFFTRPKQGIFMFWVIWWRRSSISTSHSEWDLHPNLTSKKRTRYRFNYSESSSHQLLHSIAQKPHTQELSWTHSVVTNTHSTAHHGSQLSSSQHSLALPWSPELITRLDRSSLQPLRRS